MDYKSYLEQTIEERAKILLDRDISTFIAAFRRFGILDRNILESGTLQRLYTGSGISRESLSTLISYKREVLIGSLKKELFPYYIEFVTKEFLTDVKESKLRIATLETDVKNLSKARNKFIYINWSKIKTFLKL